MAETAAHLADHVFPPFAMERLRQRGADLVYHCPKPQSGGKRADLVLTQLELTDRIAALVPPPRTHRHRYFGVLAPNALLRAAVTALAQAVPLQAGDHHQLVARDIKINVLEVVRARTPDADGLLLQGHGKVLAIWMMLKELAIRMLFAVSAVGGRVQGEMGSGKPP